MSDIHPKNTFAVQKGTSKKQQVPVIQGKNSSVLEKDLMKVKITDNLLKELISGAAKNQS